MSPIMTIGAVIVAAIFIILPFAILSEVKQIKKILEKIANS